MIVDSKRKELFIRLFCTEPHPAHAIDKLVIPVAYGRTIKDEPSKDPHPAEVALAREHAMKRIGSDACALVKPEGEFRIRRDVESMTFKVERWQVSRMDVEPIFFRGGDGADARLIRHYERITGSKSPTAVVEWVKAHNGFLTFADAEAWLRQYLGVDEKTYYDAKGNKVSRVESAA